MRFCETPFQQWKTIQLAAKIEMQHLHRELQKPNRISYLFPPICELSWEGQALFLHDKLRQTPKWNLRALFQKVYSNGGQNGSVSVLPHVNSETQKLFLKFSRKLSSTFVINWLSTRLVSVKVTIAPIN